MAPTPYKPSKIGRYPALSNARSLPRAPEHTDRRAYAVARSLKRWSPER